MSVKKVDIEIPKLDYQIISIGILDGNGQLTELGQDDEMYMTVGLENNTETYKIQKSLSNGIAYNSSTHKYDITTPMRIGRILNKPFPQILKITITANAISARIQFCEALETADGASERPMQMMIGPVTTGGRKRMTRFTPTSLMMSASTR